MNPQALLACALCLLAAVPAQARDCSAARVAPQRRDADTIQRIERGWLAAEYHGDVAFLDCLLSPGYGVIVAHDDRVRSKADLLQRVAGNAGKDTPVPALQTRVVVDGDHATAYSTMRVTGKDGVEKTVQYVDAYVFDDGAWQAVGGVDL